MITVWGSLESSSDKRHRNMDSDYVMELYRISLLQTMTQNMNNDMSWSSFESVYNKQKHRNVNDDYVMELS